MFQGNFEFFAPTRILIGGGQLSEIGHRSAKLGKKALLVTGKTSMAKAGTTDRVRKYLEEEGIESILFNQVEPNPGTETVRKGAQLGKKENCDLVIGLGGGSALDAAKAIAVAISHGDNVRSFFGRDKIPGPTLPIIAIPSTSGTGSEITPYSVLTDEEANRKDALSSEFILPKVSIVDPEIAMSQSPYLTSCTGMDALSHALEAYASPIASPFSDAVAAETIRLVSSYLRKAVRQGDDIEARSAMSSAATLGGMAVRLARAGAAHGLGQSVGALFHTDHGTTVGILLPYVMEFNMPAQAEKYAYVASLMGQKIEGLSIREAALLSVQAVRELIRDVDIPDNLSALGADIGKAQEIAEDAITQLPMKNNIRQPTLEEAKELYCRALG